MNPASPESNGDSKSDPSSLEGGSHALDAVLEATLAQGRRKIKPEEWDRLRKVLLAAQQGGLPMDQWCVALVRELLEIRLPQPVLKSKSLDHMSRMIASTLCSDPASKQRLTELQSQLLGDDRL